jgi:hypothetical protein
MRANGTCTCGSPTCPDVAKHPRTLHGFKDATTDLGRIAHWWRQWPGANPAAATGHVFDILDLDGVEPDAWQREHGYALPLTWRVRTGSGGEHWYFRPAPGLRNRVKKIPGADTRALGGYALLPPSLHRSGGRYEWIVPPNAAQLAPWPADLLAALMPPKMPPPSMAARPAGMVRHIPEGLIRFAERGAPLGQQHNAAFWLACRLRGHGADDQAALAILETFARACTPPADWRKVVACWNDSQRYQGHEPTRYAPAPQRIRAVAVPTPTRREAVPVPCPVRRQAVPLGEVAS